MDFEELKDDTHEKNVKKNRATLVVLFVLFITPVAIAYLAYFSGWFSGASQNKGELLTAEAVLDIEDFEFRRADGKVITGKEFETLYWWLVPIEPSECDQACLQLNIYTVHQTYIGLGKESSRINPLLVLPAGSDIKVDKFPLAYSNFSSAGVKSLAKTRSGQNKDLKANAIYLVDPLGNIFMRYPLVQSKDEAAKFSRDLRTDLLRLFKYSRLG